jgi:nucleoside-diphosphate-sugar epimerase
MKYTLPENSRVLVTGATGFTGRHLVGKLLAQKAKIKIIARPSSRSDELKALGCEVFEGQIYDPETVRLACRDIDYIFHIAAAFREAGVSDDIYSKVHVESTKLLANAACEIPGFKRFVHISTVGVHGHIEHPPANEEAPYGPGDLYQATKLEAELWIRDFARQRGMSMSVIRPTAIYGPGDRRLLKIFRMAQWPVFPIIGFGKCLYHMTHVEDLANSFLLAAIHPRADQEVFICGDPETISLIELVHISAEVTGHMPKILRLPATPFFLLGDLCELVCKPLKIEPPIYRRRVAFYTKDRSFDTSKLRNYLGFEHAYSNRTGIIETVKWYKEQGWI